MEQHLTPFPRSTARRGGGCGWGCSTPATEPVKQLCAEGQASMLLPCEWIAALPPNKYDCHKRLKGKNVLKAVS